MPAPACGEPDPGRKDKRPENGNDPSEAPDRPDPRHEKRRAKHDGAGNAPEEQAPAAARLHAELLEHEREHEDIVHAQAELDQIAREVLLRRLGAAPQPDEAPESEAKHQAGKGDDGVPRPEGPVRGFGFKSCR